MQFKLKLPRHTDSQTVTPKPKRNAPGPLPGPAASAPVQRLETTESEDASGDPVQIQEVARASTQGPSQPLPFLKDIQRSFGSHDVSNVKAHSDGFAQRGTQQLFARAFAHGNHVAFSKPPSLYQAAHEAAHVVQQRSGLSLPGGMGKLGDPHERHADAVANAVVQGRSSESLLNQYKSSSGATTANSTPPVQGDLIPEWFKKMQRDRAIANQQPRAPKTGKNWKWGGTALGQNSKSIAMWNPTPNTKIKVKNDELVGDRGELDRNFLVQLFEGNRQKGRVNINYDHELRELKPDTMQASGGYGQGNGALLGRELIKAMLLPQVREQTQNADHLKLNCVNPLSAHIAIKQLNLRWTTDQDTTIPAATTAASAAVSQLQSDGVIPANGTTKYGYRVVQFSTMWGRMANLATNYGVVFTFQGNSLDSNTDFADANLAAALMTFIAEQGKVRGGGNFALDIRSPIPG